MTAGQNHSEGIYLFFSIQLLGMLTPERKKNPHYCINIISVKNLLLHTMHTRLVLYTVQKLVTLVFKIRIH